MSYTTAEEQIAEQQPAKEKCFKLAKVVSLTENSMPTVRFYGEETESEKSYNFIKGYTPVIGDTVLMASMSETYVIIGKVAKELVEYITPDQLTEALDTLENIYALINHTHEYLTNSTGYRATMYGKNLVPSHVNEMECGTINSFWSEIHCMDMFVNGNSQRKVYTEKIYYSSYDTTRYAQVLTDAFISGNNANLGNSSNKWNTLYATTGTINTSDKRQKKNIQNLSTKYKNLFMKLNPKRFMFRKGSSGRYHTGFIAQEVESAMKECDIKDSEFAGFIKSPIYKKKDKDGVYDTNSEVVGHEYGLRYSEFIALNTMMIQELVKDNEELKKRVEALERKHDE